MNRLAAEQVWDMLQGNAQNFRIVSDGHNSYWIELYGKELVYEIKKRLDDLKIMDYPIELLERPHFYKLH